MILTFLAFSLWHSASGLLHIINDYIHEKSLRYFLLHLSQTIHLLAFLTLFTF